MVKKRRSPLTLVTEPERRFAALFSKHHNLAPPVQVIRILNKYARVKKVDLPPGWDGVVLHSAGVEPSVLLSVGSNDNRMRFTAAHELAHIVLPWQRGTVYCNTREHMWGLRDYIVKTIESEANGFASELLVPSKWLERRTV